jgi:choline dehydrogenase-like flavoprotein
MSALSLNIQLITVSILTLQREIIHLRESQRNQLNNTYDYIIVGSGSAGSVVASRLSENSSVSVLLLEAGVPDSVITDIPSLGLESNGWTFAGTQYDWDYSFAPQERAAQAFINNQFRQIRGKVLGGTSSLNSLFYNRGNKRDFDNWVNTYGAKGWSYEEVLPYFLRSENNTDSDIVSNNGRYHAIGGPLTVTTVQKPDPVLTILQTIAEENGIPVIDFNGATQLGQSISFIL